MSVDVRDMLEAAGVQALRVSSKEIHGRCPMHRQRTGREDRHPSWSINRTTFLHSCFSCGYAGTLTDLLVDLTGSAPVDLEETLNKESFLRRMTEARRDPEETVTPELTEWILSHRTADVPERLLTMRYLRRAAIDRYQVRWDQEFRQWVLPLRGIDGALLGAQYRQKGSVFTLPEGMEKSKTFFGYEVVKHYDYAVLVESPLDAVRLYGLGIPAFSSLGAWISQEQVRIMARLFSHVILALDNDRAGRDASDIVIPMLNNAHCPTVRWDYTNLRDEDGKAAKDVGDVPDDAALLEAWDHTTRGMFNESP